LQGSILDVFDNLVLLPTGESASKSGYDRSAAMQFDELMGKRKAERLRIAG
jgi:hypothetical protein